MDFRPAAPPPLAPDAVPKVIERGVADGKGRARHDADPSVLKQFFPQIGADIDRSRMQSVKFLRLSGLLDPIDMRLVLVPQKRRDLFARIANPSPQILQLDALLIVVYRPNHLLYHPLEARQRLRQRVRYKIRAADAILAPFPEVRRFPDRFEKCLHRVEQRCHLAHGVRAAQKLEHPFSRLRIIEPMEHVTQSVLGNAQSNLPRGDTLERMGLVENDKVVGENVAAFALLGFASAEVEKEQGVIHHHHVRRKKPLSGTLVKAARVFATRSCRADMLFAADLRPDVRVRLDGKIGECSVLRSLRPFVDPLQLALLGRGKQISRAAHRALQPRRTKIVLPPFPQHGLELDGQNLLQNRDVFVNELLLQVDRAR